MRKNCLNPELLDEAVQVEMTRDLREAVHAFKPGKPFRKHRVEFGIYTVKPKQSQGDAGTDVQELSLSPARRQQGTQLKFELSNTPENISKCNQLTLNAGRRICTQWNSESRKNRSFAKIVGLCRKNNENYDASVTRTTHTPIEASLEENFPVFSGSFRRRGLEGSRELFQKLIEIEKIGLQDQFIGQFARVHIENSVEISDIELQPDIECEESLSFNL